MGKKKLKFKFLFVFLFSVITLGLVSFNTFAFSTNASVGDKVEGFSFNEVVWEDITNNYPIVEFSDGTFLWIDDDNEYLVLGSSYITYEPYIAIIEYGAEYLFEDSNVYIVNFFNENVENIEIEFYIVEPTFIESLFEVFSNIGSSLMVLINGLIVIFYANNQLTFLGILALCGLAIAIILLILNIIQNFLHFRG